MAKYVLSIDQGTTSSRAIVYDKNGKAVASARREFPQYFPRPGWVEHDADEIWESVSGCVQRVLDEIPVRELDSIGIANQRETTVIWDGKTGKPVHNAIVWQCRRTTPRCDELKKKADAFDFFKEKTGLPIDAYWSATKVEWILNNTEGALAGARNGRLIFGTVDTWLLWKLTGGEVHATDYSNASRTMLFNIEKKRWDPEILEMFDIPPKMLPDVKPSSGVFGHTAGTGKLPSEIPISGIAGDQQAALFGQTCFKQGSIKNTYGTGCFILLNTGKKRLDSKYGLLTTIGCNAQGKPAYVLEGGAFIAGAAIQWLRDGLNILESSQQSEEMANAVDGTGGVYFVPALVGLAAPYWDSHARGAIFGLTRGTNRNHLVRAALESICYQSKDVIDVMEKDTGLKIKELRVDGGAAVNDFLCQFQSDILGRDVTRPKNVQTTSAGVAYLAGLATGFWKDAEEVGKCYDVERKFKPEMAEDMSRDLYRGWGEAVGKTLTGDNKL